MFSNDDDKKNNVQVYIIIIITRLAGTWEKTKCEEISAICPVYRAVILSLTVFRHDSSSTVPD